MVGHSLYPTNPMVTVLMGMMLYQQRQLDELGERIEALEDEGIRVGEK